MRLATTRCTNALLENSGESPVLFITSGFADLLKIGDQRRNNLFSLIPDKRVPLCEEVVEIKERVDRHGVILQKPDLNEIEKKRGKSLKLGTEVQRFLFFTPILIQHMSKELPICYVK